MERGVIDASVAVKLFVPEKGSKQAWELFNQSIDNDLDLLAPNFLCLEVLNALIQSYDLPEDQLARILIDLSSLGIHLYRENPSFLRQVLEYSKEFNITVYDASYLALALFYGCTLYTSDKKHHKKEYYDKIVYI